MANPIFLPKRSNTALSVPTTSNLVDGELAVNSADKRIYLRDGSDIVEIANASYISEGNTIYVSKDGSDTNSGDTLDKPLLTVVKALSIATSGDTIKIGCGVFEEVFPLTVPVGVTVKGMGIRSTLIKPTSGTKTNDCFLLNGETTVEDLTIADMFEPGYAFRFATNMKTTIRSPYIQRVTVLNKGSTTSSTDPYGFNTTHNPTSSYKAGRGVLIDGSVVDATTLEPAMLFNECTFICPNNIGLEMKNGARTEWVNCFTYFCDKAIYATSGSTGLSGVGKTRVKISGISGAGSPAADDLLYYFDETSRNGTYTRTGTTVTVTFNSHGLSNGDRIAADFTSGGAQDGVYAISNVSTNTFDLTTSASGTITTSDVTYKKALAYGTISTYSSGTVTLTGKGTGTFQTAASRSGKVVTAYADAKLSTAQFKFGTASLSLDGTGDYARSEGGSDFSFAGDFTVEKWIYPTSVTGTKYVFSLGSETTGRYNLFLDGEVVKGNFYGSSTTTFGGSISTNTWTHVALVRSGSTITAYVNGTALGTTETNSSTIGNTGQLTIGADTSGASTFNGYIDEFRLSSNARYTGTFTPATSAFTSDSNTKLLLHFDGDSGSTQFTDSTLVVQDIRIIDNAVTDGSTNLLTATTITLADYQQFGASMRSIGSAAVFGNSGVNADGLGISLRLFAFNFGHIGAGGDFSQDESLVNQANEVIITNGAKVQFVSIDQSGDFRVGNAFYVNEEKGIVSFGGQSFNVSSLSNLTITDGTNSTALTPTSITSGGLQLSSNTLSTTSGNLTINPAGAGTTTIEGNVTINGTLSATSTSFSSISTGDTQVAITDTGANGTITLQADNTTIQSITSAGTNVTNPLTVRTTTATQDGIRLAGRAGGTGSFFLTIAPGALTASATLSIACSAAATLTIPTGATTLVAGTMVTTATAQTITAVKTYSPTARISGSGAYYILTTPADTGQTASIESIGANWTAATRTWATGALTLQRERVFNTPTYSFVAASTLTTAINVDIATPAAGANATITNAYALRAGESLFTNNITVQGLTASQAVFTDANYKLVSVATTGSGNVVLATSPTLSSPTFTTPVLGTPTSGTLTNCTGYTVGNLSGLGTGVATFLATPSSANLASAITDETGSGALVFATSPSLITPNLGTATASSVNGLSLTANATGFSVAGGTTSKTLTISNTLTFTGTDGSSVAFGAGGTVAYQGGTLAQFAATTSAQLLGVISDETGTGALVFATSPTLVTPVLGTPTSGTLTNCTGYTVGNLSGLGTGVSTFLATPSSANLASAVTDETGTGALVFANTPTLVTPVIGAATGTSLSITGAFSTTSTTTEALALTGAVPSTNSNVGFVRIGQTLAFNDTDKILTGVSNVNSYGQMILQNLSSGTAASSDYVVNNDRAGGTTIYGDFGINSSTFAGGGAFGDIDGTYLYGAGGTCSLGTFGAFSTFLSTNNVKRISIDSTGITSILGTGTAASPFRFNDADNSAFIGIQAPTTVTSYTITLPASSSGVANQTLQFDASNNASFVSNTRTAVFVIDGGGDVIPTGIKGTIIVDADYTLTAWSINGGIAGAVSVAITQASPTYPTTTAPTFNAVATASLTATQFTARTTGLNTTVTTGDIFQFDVTANAGNQTRVTVALRLVPR